VKGLIIDEPWISLILAGEKTWEMRTRNIGVRGRIALIRKGSKAVAGVADLVDTVPQLSIDQVGGSTKRHCVPAAEIDADFQVGDRMGAGACSTAWRAVPYDHPAGAVIWVNLNADVADAVAQRLMVEGTPP
jgi:hypothetical protein